MSYRQITATLEQLGVLPRSGKRWYPSAVRKIALREDIAGLERDARLEAEPLRNLDLPSLDQAG
jgi:hypothetical protein